MAKESPLRSSLTPQELEILDVVIGLGDRNGYQPTMREIQVHLGFASVSSVHGHLSRLRRLGAVTWLDDSPRTLVVTPSGRRALLEAL